jgi:hypothetical protein
MTEHRPIPLDGSDVRYAGAALLVAERGWRAVTDAGAMPTLAPHDVRALAAGLRDGRAEAWLDTPEERSWLRDQLRAIAAHDTNSRRFVDDVGDAGLIDLADRLASDYAHIARPPLEPGADARLAVVAGAAASLGRIIGHAAGGHVPAWLPGIVERMSIDAAVLVVAGLDVGARITADLAMTLVERIWIDLDPLDAFTRGVDPAALLFATLARDPATASAFLEQVVEHPWWLVRVTTDDAAVLELLRSGTDPASTTAADAGRILVPLFAHGTTPPAGPVHDDVHLARLLAEVSAPWLVQFGARRPPEWNWCRTDADGALRWMLADPDAAEALTSAVAAIPSTFDGDAATLDPAGAEDRLTEIGYVFAQVHRAMADVRIDEAAQQRFAAEVFSIAVGIGIGVATAGLGLAAGAAIGLTTDVALGLLAGTSADDPGSIERALQVITTSGLAVIAAGVVVAVVRALVDCGAIADPGRALDPIDVTAGARPSTADVLAFLDRDDGPLAAEPDEIRDRLTSLLFHLDAGADLAVEDTADA